MDEGADSLMADTLIAGTTLVEKESRSVGDVPIGGIVAWAKSLTAVPNLAEGWVECDGAVLVDALSPLNGQTIPDLIGSSGTERFLRGQTTSGGTGGSETHVHTNTSDTVQSGTGKSVADDVNVGSTSTLPTYYEVVWIMRVR